MGDNFQATGTGIGDGIGKWEMGKNLKSETCRFQLHWYHPTGVESSYAFIIRYNIQPPLQCTTR